MDRENVQNIVFAVVSCLLVLAFMVVVLVATISEGHKNEIKACARLNPQAQDSCVRKVSR